jgi:hypothetical protein
MKRTTTYAMIWIVTTLAVVNAIWVTKSNLLY